LRGKIETRVGIFVLIALLYLDMGANGDGSWAIYKILHFKDISALTQSSYQNRRCKSRMVEDIQLLTVATETKEGQVSASSSIKMLYCSSRWSFRTK
jgi:hypothetical protein